MVMEDTIGIGSILGGFKIEKELGRGGMGVVYKAHELSLNRKVALKVLSKRLSSDEEFVKRFKREAEVVAALKHPNIVSILSYGEEHGLQYFAMEYVRGKDLSQILVEKSLIPLEEALSITAQVASALDEAGARGVVHRDLKPANIMVGEMGSVKVTDFGVAHFQDADAKLTRTGLFLGTPEYASPEQARGQRLDVRSDIYGLGAVLYRMLSGEAPIKGESPLAVVAKIITEPVTPIGEVNPSVPKPVCELIGKMMAKEPNDRFQSPKEVLLAIDGCIDQLKVDAPLAKSKVAELRTTVEPIPKRTGTAKVLGGIIGLALAVFLIVWLAEGVFAPRPDAPPSTPDVSAPAAYEPTATPVMQQPIPANHLLVRGQFVPKTDGGPPPELAGGVISSNIGDKTPVSQTGQFQFKNTRPVLPTEQVVISGILYAEDQRMFRPEGGTFQAGLVDATELALGDIPLEPYTVKIDDIPIIVTDWAGAPVSEERLRVNIGDKAAAWDGNTFVGAWTFTKADEKVPLKAEYVMRDGRRVVGKYMLAVKQFDIQGQPEPPPPITIRLSKPAPPPLPRTPTVLVAVSGDETLKHLVQAHLESNLGGSGLKVTSVSEIPVLYEKMQFGETPLTWYGIKQFVPKGTANILLLAQVQKTGSMPLEYYGRIQELTTASFSVQAVDMATGRSAAAPATGSVQFTSLNMEENFRKAVDSAVAGMGVRIREYWQQKIKGGKGAG